MTYLSFALFDQPTRFDFAPGIYLAVKGAGDALSAWRERSRTRAQLARPGDRILKDIGLSRSDAGLEARKPFWRE
jgi:uncharacterized protein YjiS (DUF1127 family)